MCQGTYFLCISLALILNGKDSWFIENYLQYLQVNAYLKQKLGFNKIYRLSGGIISYENWAAEGNGSRFKGKNYVFDGCRKRFIKNSYDIDNDNNDEKHV